MAGGGGTRLHPLSRPERPKPFLPLLGDESLLQATERRLRRLTDDITVVTESRYERLVRDQLPDAALLLEPMGRNTAAAIALATIALDRPPDDVMLVVPADAHIDPGARGHLRARPARSPPTTSRRGRSRSSDPLVTLGTQVIRPAVEYGYLLPDLARGADIGEPTDPIRAYPLKAFEEKPKPGSGRGPVQTHRRRRLERGHVPLAPAGDPSRAHAGTRASSSRSSRCSARADHAGPRLRGDPARRSRSTTPSWRARRATARSRWRRWMSAGRTSGRGRRCSARSALAAKGPSSRPARRSRSATTISWSAASTDGSGSSPLRSAVA